MKTIEINTRMVRIDEIRREREFSESSAFTNIFSVRIAGNVDCLMVSSRYLPIKMVKC